MFGKVIPAFFLIACSFPSRALAESFLDDWPNASPEISELARAHETISEILEAKKVIDQGRLPEMRSELLDLLDRHARAALAVTVAGEDREKRQAALSQLFRTKTAVKNAVMVLTHSPPSLPGPGPNASYFEKHYSEVTTRIERALLVNNIREDLAGVAHDLGKKEELRIEREKLFKEMDLWRDMSAGPVAEQDLRAARLLGDREEEARALLRKEKFVKEEAIRITKMENAEAWRALNDRIGEVLGYTCIGTFGVGAVGTVGALGYALFEMDRADINRQGCRKIYERIPTGEGLKLVAKYRSSLPKVKKDQIEVDSRKYGPSKSGARENFPEGGKAWRMDLGDGVHLWLDGNSRVLGGNDEKNKDWPGLAPRDVPETEATPPLLTAPKRGEPRLEILPIPSSRSVSKRVQAAWQVLRGKEPFTHGLAIDYFPGEVRVATDDGRLRLRVRHATKDSILELALPNRPPLTLDHASVVELLRKKYPNFEPRAPEGPLPEAEPNLFQKIRPTYAALQGNWGPQEYRGEGFTVRRNDPEVDLIDSSRHLIIRYNPHTLKTRLLLNPWELSEPPFDLTRDMLTDVPTNEGKPEMTDFDDWVASQR